MSNIRHSITELVGHTPLLELTGYEKAHGLKAHLLAKLEYLNPTGSVKDRPALNMLLAAEREGKIHPGDTIVDTTSGNTGIGLAAFAVSKGYKVEEILEDGVSVEREQILAAYGVTLHHNSDFPGIRKMQEDGTFNMPQFVQEIQNYCDGRKDKCFYLNQMANPHNPEAHQLSTGPEIWQDTDGHVDILVCMVGTAGTITGNATYLRGQNPALKVVAVQPAPESIPSAANPDANNIDGVVPFDGLPASAQPPLLKPGIYDECIDVITEDAYVTARELARYDGIFIGTSSAAAALAATRVAERSEYVGKNIVIIMPDNGFKYLSTPMFAAGTQK